MLHSHGPTPAVLCETSNLSHRLFKYVGIMLKVVGVFSGEVGSVTLGAALTLHGAPLFRAPPRPAALGARCV
jgi:hypothetical protein